MPSGSGASSASMNTATSFSSSWLGSSPSRQSPNRNGVRSPKGSLMAQPFESPSRQFQLEYNQLLSHSDREFNKRLDQDAAERAKLHHEQLAKAAHEHQRVQKEAEREMERIRLEEDQERMRKAIAQERELERLKQEKLRQEAEIRRQQLEAKRREEEAVREAAENQRKLQEAEARIKAQKEQEEQARKKKEDEEQKAREAAKAALQNQRTQPPPTTQAPPALAAPRTAMASTAGAQPTASSPSADIAEVHKKYLALHAGMKQFRKQFLEAHKSKGDPFKPHIGEVRRNMNKRLGQITTELQDSKTAIAAIRTECFDKALSTPGPTIDIRPFIISGSIPQLANEAEAQYPQLLLYAWICLEKSLINQWYNEASKEDGRIIGQLGLIAASLYLDQRYMWKGSVCMIDTLLAKLHRICPMLFGIRGDMQNNRAGLGLDKFHINDDSDMNRYSQRVMGIGAGFAAISFRKFGGKPPAIPLSEYWRVVVLICNTPSDDLYPGHFLCLQGLLRDNVKRFLMNYGVHGRAVLRRAVYDLPNRIPKGRKGVAEAASLVKVLPDTWKAKEHISIG
ncbi:hypothetical protein N0V90_006771 [Kalmusia sp. IMI 367209]|nr:hypothetical protein N0V90_006771 [Kalmusia sp. IMI 367209]